MKAQHAMLGGVGLVIASGLVWYGMAASSPHANESLPNRAQISDAPAVQAADATTRVADDVPSQRDNAADAIVELTDVVTQTDDASTAVTMRWIEGRTLDPRGEPLVGVEVVGARLPARNELDAVLTQSDGDGRFRFETDAERLAVYGRRPGFVTVYTAHVDETTTDEVRVVLAPCVHLEGRVVDSDGQGIEGALLQVTRDAPGLVGFPFSLDGNSREFVPARTTADGSFSYRQAPRIDGFELRVQAVGFEPARIEVPEAPQYDLSITLERAEVANRQSPKIFGTVLLPDGNPASGASVEYAGTIGIANREGSFEIAAAVFDEIESPLVARLDGWQPAVWYHVPEPGRPPAYQTGPLHLVLPGRELTIRGHLQLADGSPAQNWHFRLIEPRARRVARATGDELPNLLEPQGTAMTDERGMFEIVGLAPGEYALRMWCEDPFGAFDSAPIPAGARDVVLRVPEQALYASLTGRVTFKDGAPVVGANVNIQFTVERSSGGWTTRGVDRTTTDTEGMFELNDVPRIGSRLKVTGDGFIEHDVEPPNGDLGPGPLAIEVQRLIQARVDASSADPIPEAFSILDAGGKPLSLSISTRGSQSIRSVMPLEAGVSGVFTVPESAATLVLLRDDPERPEELSRHAITLVPGDVNVLTP